MRKRGYIYVYAVFVMALLFMVVVSVTDNNINKNRLSSNMINYNNLKYKSESNAYQAVDHLINPSFFDSKVILHFRKGLGKQFNHTETLNSVIGEGLTYDVKYKTDISGIIKVSFINHYEDATYKNEGFIKLFNDLYYISDNVVDLNKESEDYSKLIDSGYIDNYMEKVLFLDDFENITITNANGKLAYTTDDISEDSSSDPDHVEDEGDLSQNTDNKYENQLEPEGIKKGEIKDSTKDIFEEDSNNSDDTIPDDAIEEIISEEEDNTDEDVKDDSTEEPLDEEQKEPIENPKEDPTEEPPEDLPNQNDELDFVFIDTETYKTLVIGPSTRYISDSSLVLDGILKINSDTVIDADITHRGLIILESEPKHIRGVINLEGALFSSIGQPSYINFESQKSRLEKHGSIFKGFFEPKVVDFHFSY